MADSTRSLITRTTWIWAVVLAVVAVVSDQASKAWARGALVGRVRSGAKQTGVRQPLQQGAAVGVVTH